MDNKLNGILNHLASMPGTAHASVTRAEAQKIMLDTGGQQLAQGRLWEVKVKHIGAGVYRVQLKRL